MARVLDWHEQRNGRLTVGARGCVCAPLVSRTRRRHFGRPACRARRAGRVLGSCYSPVVKYHGLGRATGFGVARNCTSFVSMCDSASRPVRPGTGWTTERAGLRSRRSKSNDWARWFYPSPFAMGAVLTAAAKPGGAPGRRRRQPARGFFDELANKLLKQTAARRVLLQCRAIARASSTGSVFQTVGLVVS
jgi:hypothetical protein